MEEMPTIEQFRAMILEKFAKKGVRPPDPNSTQERRLFDQWIKGRKKLEELNNGYKGSTSQTK